MVVHIKHECKRCKSKNLIDFRELNIVEDVAYMRTECEECGYWEIENHKGHLIRTSESVMRNATREELESVDKYIKSISKPTGVNFFDEKDVFEKLKDILMNYFDINNDTYAYNLTRDKKAFSVGTMSFEDFEEFSEETIDDIVRYVRENI